MDTVRINTKLNAFRKKAYYDRDGAAQKLWKFFTMHDF